MTEDEMNDVKYIVLVIGIILIVLITSLTFYNMYSKYLFAKNGYTQEVLPGSSSPSWVLPKR